MVDNSSYYDLIINKANFISYKKGSISKDYNFGKPLGSGSFGTVREAVHKLTGQSRAIKILKKSEQDEEKLFLEVDILAKLTHPNIMQIFEFYDDNTNFYIVSEYCQGGELFDCITDKGIFTEKEACLFMKQILSAVCYSHKNNVVHRDLKPENIVLDEKCKNPILKIIDWGGARYFLKNKKMNRVNGTPYYIAPEVLNECYDEKCDIWSCGVMLYIFLCGYPPFNGDSDTEIMKSVKKGVYDFPAEEWGTVSKDAKDFVSSMLKYDPKSRLSAKDCLTHPWIKKYEELSDLKITSTALAKMQKFKLNRKLEQATLAYIVNQLLSKEDRNKLLSQFQSFDKNNDGVLTKEEILFGYRQLYGESFNEADVDLIMKSVDTDSNGTIDYNEFLSATLDKDKLTSKSNLEIAFKSFDKDGSGKINLNEIKGIFNNPKVKDDNIFEKMIKEADDNQDGEISLEEFKILMINFFN